MRASHIGRLGAQSLATPVSPSRVLKSLSVRSITHRSPGAQANEHKDRWPDDRRGF
jgi:hypothetical protein